MRAFAGIGLGVLLFVSVSPARADEPPPPSVTDDARLENVLETAASQERQSRIGGIVGNAAFVAIVTPPGVVLVTKSDHGQQIAGVGLLIDGGWALYSIPWMAFPEPMERLRDHYRGRKARGESSSAVIAETESEWQEIRRSAHESPFLIGLSLLLGGAEVAVGMYLMIADSGAVGTGRQTQTTWGAVLVGGGLPALVRGIRHLLPSTSGPEAWWRAYKGPESRGPSAARIAPSLAVIPTFHGGATGVVRFAF